MKEQNGIQIYEQGEKPPIPKHLDTNFEVISPFGFKIVQVDGKDMWQVATEEDYREAKAQRLGIAKEQVQVGKNCYNINPEQCRGTCMAPLPWCTLCYKPGPPAYYFCDCTG